MTVGIVGPIAYKLTGDPLLALLLELPRLSTDISKIATPIAEVLVKLKKPNHVVMLYEIKKKYRK